MKVYLDDERVTPEGWMRTYWPEEVIELLKTGKVTELSLDHDLGDDDHGTGYTVLLWLEEQVAVHGMKPPVIRVHSANSSARIKMESAIASINRFANINRPAKFPRWSIFAFWRGLDFSEKFVVICLSLIGGMCLLFLLWLLTTFRFPNLWVSQSVTSSSIGSIDNTCYGPVNKDAVIVCTSDLPAANGLPLEDKTPL